MSEQEYFVEWRIEICAESPEDAARKALEIQRDHGSIATVFHVTGEDGEVETLDLTEIDADRAIDNVIDMQWRAEKAHRVVVSEMALGHEETAFLMQDVAKEYALKARDALLILIGAYPHDQEYEP